MRVDVLTREYPPEVYGGAGVHVGELVSALRRELDVIVRCFGAPRDEQNVFPYLVPPELVGANPSLAALGSEKAGSVTVDGEPWFVVADVCAVLGLVNPSEAEAYLDDDERCLISKEACRNNGGMQAISEVGLNWLCDCE